MFRSDVYLAENRLVVPWTILVIKEIWLLSILSRIWTIKRRKNITLTGMIYLHNWIKKLNSIYASKTGPKIENYLLYSAFLNQSFQTILFNLRREKIIIFFLKIRELSLNFLWCTECRFFFFFEASNQAKSKWGFYKNMR